MLLASIIGSSTAQIALMSRVMVPSMEKEGYPKEFSSATTATAGLLGPIISPSKLFIIYGVGSGASIGSMFLAGVLAGIILALAFIILIGYMGWKQKWPTSKKATFTEMSTSFVKVLPALLVPIIIIAGILSGAFTPTESAAFACIVALIVGFFFYKELKIKDLPGVMINTTISTATITMLIAMANLFGWMLSFEKVPHTIATWMTSLSDNPIVFLLIVNIFLLIVGMFMDGIAALIILVPIFIPIIASYGIDPVHFGVIICINLTIGLLTPPVGTGLYIASALGNVKLESLSRAILPFLAAAFIALAIITYWPEMVLWLPNLLK
ncbi:TRAP transporter large permease [Mesobacillus maritimus]|uniref:TRAP transporter large permease n=1 Tax=Mesobacillus maritimus TaxID=1643336 RepID=UPI00384BFF8F